MKLKCSLIFYIGNGVVKGAIVSFETGKIPKILTTRIRELPHFNERDREHLENRILFEFGELVSDIKREDFKNVSFGNEIKIINACVVMSSPWYISETSIIKMNEQKPFLVTDDLLSKERQNIVKAYTDAHKVDVAVLEQKIIRIALNGYITNDPVKKKAQTLDMTIFTSFARHSSVDDIKKIISQHFNIKSIDIHSQSLVAFSVIEDIWTDVPQYIITDITSQLTELVTVRKGALSEAASFPMGKQFLVKKISEKLNVTSEVAESLIRLKNDGSVDPDLALKLQGALDESKAEWLKAFSEALSNMSSSASLPSKFFLFAPKDVSHIFSDYMTSEEYQQFSFAEGKFEVHEVTSLDLTKYCTNESQVPLDLSIILGTLFNTKIVNL